MPRAVGHGCQNGGLFTHVPQCGNVPHPKVVDIGVDCEIIREPKTGAIERVLSRAEKKALKSIEPTKKTEYLLSVWSKKESAFKRMVKGKFLPSKINTFKYDFAQKTVEVNGDLYTLNIWSEFNKNIRYFERIDF